MLNPGWQPARDNPDRLQHLERQLFGPRDGDHEGTPPRVIPVLLALASERLAGGETWDDLLDALTRQLNLPPPHGQPSRPPWALKIIDPQAPPADAGFLLVATQPSRHAVRRAYSRIKRVTAQSQPDFGILMLGTQDGATAHRYHEYLVGALRRFLGIHAIELGHLPPRGEDFGAALAHLAQQLIVLSNQRTAEPVAGEAGTE